MPQIIDRVLAFAGVAGDIYVPFPQIRGRQGQTEHTLFPRRVEDGFSSFGLGINQAQAMHATQVVRAVHRLLPGSLGDFTFSTPIMALRVTSRASSSSLQPLVSSGRSGNTRYRISEVESHTRISTSWDKSVPNSFKTPRGSATARARYGADLYQTGGSPSTGHG